MFVHSVSSSRGVICPSDLMNLLSGGSFLVLECFKNVFSLAAFQMNILVSLF